MQFLSELWMPILLSAVFVWIASGIIHMALPVHKNDYKALPNEEKAMAGLEGTPAGSYMFPFCTMEQMKDPAVMERINKGPTGVVTVWGGAVNMGRNLQMTLLSYILIGVFVAYVCWHTKSSMDSYLDVFRIAGTTAFMVHGLGHIGHAIWFKMPGSWGYVIGGAVYGLLTGGTFGWLMPLG